LTNEFRALESHSAEYFGDTRDYWWHQDYTELIGRRLRFDHVHDVLDVGCGVGHWAQLLASALPADAHVLGVDRDPLWISKATERAAAKVDIRSVSIPRVGCAYAAVSRRKL
jgi:trans-aconitate methyltransferase